MDFGTGKYVVFLFRPEIVFFDVFQALEHSWNDPGQVCEKTIFADFRRIFLEKLVFIQTLCLFDEL